MAMADDKPKDGWQTPLISVSRLRQEIENKRIAYIYVSKDGNTAESIEQALSWLDECIERGIDYI